MVKEAETFLDLLNRIRKDFLNIPVPQDISEKLLFSAEKIISSGNISAISKQDWEDYLNITGKTYYLRSLDSRELRYRWADTTFSIIRFINYDLKDLFEQRVNELNDKILFQEFSDSYPTQWSYKKIDERIKRIAASILDLGLSEPRLAILSNNSVWSACTDLACLINNIFVTPLNVHFDVKTICIIFERLDINIAVADTEEHYLKLNEVRDALKRKFRIFVLDPKIDLLSPDDKILIEASAVFSARKIKDLLTKRKKKDLHETATVMFTSGSTGEPKGICFSMYNLVTKRFARAAALPKVGENEVLLCYLPLFHTFGRYLELLGMIYWGGTYVFAGNPSYETMTKLMSQVHPTGLISIPLRWEQIWEDSKKRIGQDTSGKNIRKKLKKVVGGKLRWGLSAAGYLDPKAFRFFQKNGVELCSGFGMTEGTGGITMTPPDDYVNNSVGIPLPGVTAKFGKLGELQVAGPYIAEYLPEKKPKDGSLPAFDPDSVYWLYTGDIFKKLTGDQLTIVDRIKDIYKNTRGQTVAPRKVEQLFINVPGIKNTFLVGDGRDYNVLLIVPEKNDPVFQALDSEEDIRKYYNQILTAANQELAPYERIINFEILKRDFNVDKKELTPKGSFKRKNIETNFSTTIKNLYKRKYVELSVDRYKILIPRWFFRDNGITEDDIVVRKNKLFNRYTGKSLIIKNDPKENNVQIGDLEYKITDNKIDLGLISRQPRLWIGNPAVIDFCPCKEGWELKLKNFSPQVFIPFRRKTTEDKLLVTKPKKILYQKLLDINRIIIHALFDTEKNAKKAIEKLEHYLKREDIRLCRVIRRRLESLARHPAENIRCLAYRILLLHDPTPDYGKVLPSFINSGLQFINEESISILANKKVERLRLESLRKRLFHYRTQLSWPANDITRKQFERILELLVNFAMNQTQFYVPVRAELASWILHRSDPKLSKTAEKLFHKLVDWYENRLSSETPEYGVDFWNKKIVFDNTISDKEVNRLKKVLFDTTFIKQSVLLAFEVTNFNIKNVPDSGIWISRVLSRSNHLNYRMSINTKKGKHYDLLIILRRDFQKSKVQKTRYWVIALSRHPSGKQVLPGFGCCRPELGAMSLAFQSDLTVWEKIREYSGIHQRDRTFPDENKMRKLFVSAMETYFEGWFNSGFQIVPGEIGTNNIVFPEKDFTEAVKILSLSGWKAYENTLSMINPILLNFYKRTISHYPWSEKLLKYEWIFDSIIEKLEFGDAVKFFHDLKKDLRRGSLPVIKKHFENSLDKYIKGLDDNFFVHMPLINAIDRYNEWLKINPNAEKTAKVETVRALYRLYRLDKYPELVRYYLYRKTYFKDSSAEFLELFDHLLKKMFKNKKAHPTGMIELSDLQSVITDKKNREVFSRMIFPVSIVDPGLEVIAVGDSEVRHVFVKTHLYDKSGNEYTVREPIEPVEIGELYRLFFREHSPKKISENDRYFIVIDNQEQIVSGLCYRFEDDKIVYLDGLIAGSPLKGKDLRVALLEDFISRMTNQGVEIIKTHFYMRKFFEANSFKVDRRMGGLVRYLRSETV
ncbi:AMP-binding protein [candidate division KSB1 bacterium]